MITRNPEVSVIIPVYNREHVIERAVDSVLNQTFTSLELIVVDDGSTDNTLELLQDYDDDRIRVLRQSENSGANAARNKGLHAAEGQYIAFQDSDDRWYPEKLERQVDRMQNTPDDTGIIYSAFWNMDGFFSEYRPQQTSTRMSGDLSDHLLRHNFLGFINILVDRSVFEKTGDLDEQMPALQDWDFHLNASQHSRYHFIADPLLEKHPQESSISRDPENYVQAHQRIIQKHHRRLKTDKRALSNVRFRLGSSLVLTGRLEEGQKQISTAIQDQPGNTKYKLSLLISYLGPTVFHFCWTLHSQIRSLIDVVDFRLQNRSS